MQKITMQAEQDTIQNYIQGCRVSGTVTDCITSVKYNVFDKMNFTMERAA